MAEFPNLGEHCSQNDCKQLDFLPITCQHCQLIFCKEHYQPLLHECKEFTEKVKDVELQTANVPSGYTCFFKDCNNRELTEISCPECGNNFCLQHRHPQDHSCPRIKRPEEPMAKARALTQEIAQRPAQGKGQGRKSSKTASIVQLMKLKQKAVGSKSIPLDERVYFEVYLPKCHKESVKLVFLSKQWTVGRAVDVIADMAKVPNNNNVSTAKKLGLYRIEDGGPIPLTTTLSQLNNAATLIMEYQQDPKQPLQQYQSYG